MSHRPEEEKPQIYGIPDNFIKDGYILNGNLKTRNAIEGVLLSGAVGLLLWNLPIQDFATRLSVTLTLATPLLLLGIVGVKGDPLSVFLKNAIHWLQSKRVMFFNGKPVTRASRPVEAVLKQELPRDRIIGALSGLKKDKDQQLDRNMLTEGEDFVFEDDDDYRSNTEAQKKESKRAAAKQAAIDKKREKLAQKELARIEKQEKKTKAAAEKQQAKELAARKREDAKNARLAAKKAKEEARLAGKPEKSASEQENTAAALNDPKTAKSTVPEKTGEGVEIYKTTNVEGSAVFTSSEAVESDAAEANAVQAHSPAKEPDGEEENVTSEKADPTDALAVPSAEALTPEQTKAVGNTDTDAVEPEDVDIEEVEFVEEVSSVEVSL